ncbi:MAG: SRPBCC domain-containing protein [Candidatus Diapherotrites archaeon]|nr:SRPBCC domain-containing protein [Candidatus Diapherotrites archaeon]
MKQTVNFTASPHKVFEALMDSKQHSEFTESKCTISRKINGKISAYDGYIEGKNLELVKDKKIVQEWRASDWPEKHYSQASFELAKAKTGTQLKFTQTNVPKEQFEAISDGWKEHYWNKMIIKFNRIL